MSNETKDKDKEKPEATKGEEGFTNIMERFAGIVKKFKIKNAELVADHCAKGNLEDLEDIELRMHAMGVHPSLTTQVLSFWADEIHQPVPQRLRQRMEKETGIKTKEGREKEAVEKYAVDSETGVIRLAKEGEKAISLVEAQKLQRLIKKDLAELEERGTGGKKEPAFILGEKGAWTLNPNARIGFGEFAVFQMYQDSIKKGEPIDPVEELARREEASVRLKEAMGVKGGEDAEMAMLDKLDKLGMLKKTEGGGGTLEMLKVLGELGVIKKTGEEGRTSELDLIAKLNDLGLLQKPGEAEGTTSVTIHALETQVKELTDEMRKRELDSLKGLVGNLSSQVIDLREHISKESKLEGRYALMDKTITTIDGQLSGFRSDARPLLDSLAHGGGRAESKIRSPEEKAKIAKGLKVAVAQERRAHELEDELLFGKQEESAEATAEPAPSAEPAPAPEPPPTTYTE
ncbi:hypothetical protein ES703_13738 [subsurface metagenome]